MKRAYSLFEIILVVVILVILLFLSNFNFQRNELNEAKEQLLFHINMIKIQANNDNTFDVNDKNWFKKYWRIQFHNKNKYSGYSIYKDINLNNSADRNDIYLKDSNSGLIICGNDYVFDDELRFTKVNLLKKYNILVSVKNACRSRQILFDNQARVNCINKDSINSTQSLKSGIIIKLYKAENKKNFVEIML